MKAPPTNLPETPPEETPTKEVRVSEADESRSARSGEEGNGEIHPWPIDIVRPEHVAGPHIRMKFGIPEMKDELGRNRYVENIEDPRPSR